MADYTTKDAVDFAVDGNSSEFKNAVHDILSQRVQSAIELKKVDVGVYSINDLDIKVKGLEEELIKIKLMLDS